MKKSVLQTIFQVKLKWCPNKKDVWNGGKKGRNTAQSEQRSVKICCMAEACNDRRDYTLLGCANVTRKAFSVLASYIEIYEVSSIILLVGQFSDFNGSLESI